MPAALRAGALTDDALPGRVEHRVELLFQARGDLLVELVLLHVHHVLDGLLHHV